MSASELSHYIAGVYPGLPIDVCETDIAVAAKPRRTQRVRMKDFQDAFSGSHGKLHGYLKWFALCHLFDRLIVAEAGYEQAVAIPYSVEWALYEGQHHLSNYEFGYVLRDSVVYRGRPPFTRELFWPSRASSLRELVAPRMFIKVLDVYGDGTGVECGDTSLADLLLPVLSQTVKQMLWVPFPDDREKDDDWFAPDQLKHFSFDGEWAYPTRCRGLYIRWKAAVVAEAAQRSVDRLLRDLKKQERLRKRK